MHKKKEMIIWTKRVSFVNVKKIIVLPEEGFLDPKNIILYWQFISFLVILQSMEVLIYSPNFYLHIQDAMIFVQYCIDGFIEIASIIKL